MYDYIEIYNEYIKNDYRGMPRPKQNVIEKLWHRNGERYLAKIVPIPWQSMAKFNEDGSFRVNVRNEHKIFRMNLCPYCGIEINKDEFCVRWLSPDKHSSIITEGRVPSDVHPFHIECMKEGRIYCPFMRDEPEEHFEYGVFSDLKSNALKQLGIA